MEGPRQGMDGVWQKKKRYSTYLDYRILKNINRQILEIPSSNNYRTVFINISASKMHSNYPKDVVFKLLSISVLNF